MAAHKDVIAGFIPLLDSAVLVAAAEFGFAEAAGLKLKLVRETSWANIRDRIAVGHFDVAHMLAPMPIAATLKLTSLAVPMRAPMILGLGGNAITVSKAIGQQIRDLGWDGSLNPGASSHALAALVRDRAARGLDPLRFGVVHPFSGHAYELRYWLTSAGIVPDRDVEITVLPPPVMPDALAGHQLDGYCVGEPWNTVAVKAGTGVMVTCKQAIWPDSPEKVLGVTESWAAANPDTLAMLMTALSKAADWCNEPGNADQLARLLACPQFLDCTPEDCLPALTGRFPAAEADFVSMPEFFRFAGGADALPRREHGLWFYAQMVRWGQATYSAAAARQVTAIFDATDCAAALQLSASGSRPPARAVATFDGRIFNPDRLEDYLAGFDLTSQA